MYVCIQTCS